MNDQLAWASIMLGALLWVIGLFGSGKGPGYNWRIFGLLAVIAGTVWLVAT